MRRSTRTTLIIATAAILVIVLLVLLRQNAPPEVARLLPESDALLYLDLKPIRAATHFDRSNTQHDPAYQSFIDATGFEFERDLNEAAFAVNRMSNPLGPNGAFAYSEVFCGKFDGKRVVAYLKTVSTSQESYEGHTVFVIPSDGRSVRVAMLSYDMVAVSNTPTPEQIHSILDRYRTAALPFAGSSLLSEHYGKIPAFSLGWAIGHVGADTWEKGGPEVLGVRIPIAADSTLIASVRWLGSARLRIEELAPNPQAAEASASTVAAFLTLAKGAEGLVPLFSGDGEVKELLNSTKVEQKGSQAVLTATLPTGLLKDLSSAPEKLGSPAPLNKQPGKN